MSASCRFPVRTFAALSLAILLGLARHGLLAQGWPATVTPTAATPTAATPTAATPTAATPLPAPLPLEAGAQVITLWPPDAPALRRLAGWDQPEQFRHPAGQPDRVAAIVNIHNPSIEVHLPPPEKANGMGVIVAAGGGNKTLNVGTEGTDIAAWLNEQGMAAFIERYRLQPYDSATDALADTQRAVRLVRARAASWKVDPHRIGVMGFSAGGEQAARVALNFDAGHADAPDPIDRVSSRPDFVVLVYAGWAKLDLGHVPHDAPPAFLTCASIDDAFHARQTVDFYNAWFNAHVPAELHIYAHGGHGNGIKPRNGIPFGTWHLRFIEWAKDLGMTGAMAAR